MITSNETELSHHWRERAHSNTFYFLISPLQFLGRPAVGSSDWLGLCSYAVDPLNRATPSLWNRVCVSASDTTRIPIVLHEAGGHIAGSALQQMIRHFLYTS